jgi:cyclic pyranopterin phosphate synthase
MPPAGGGLFSPDPVLSLEEIVRFVSAIAEVLPVAKVHLTGGEPLLRRGIVDLVARLSRLGLQDLALTTNGVLLGELARPLRDAGLRRVNVSLHSLQPAVYSAITRGGALEPVLAGIRAAHEAGFESVKLNTVVIRHCNDGEIDELVRFSSREHCTLRFLEMMPIGAARDLPADAFVSADEVRQRLGEHFRLTPTAFVPGRSSHYFTAESDGDVMTSVGFIASETEPFCASCRRLRLTSTGRVISCLAHGDGPVIRDLIRQDAPASRAQLQETVVALFRGKTIRDGFKTGLLMAAVGG